MATIVKNENFISITSISDDVTTEQIFNNNGQAVRIRSITLIAGDADDILRVEWNGASGAVICQLYGYGAGIPSTRVFGDNQYGQSMKPFIDYTDCTLSAGHIVLIEMA